MKPGLAMFALEGVLLNSAPVMNPQAASIRM